MKASGYWTRYALFYRFLSAQLFVQWFVNFASIYWTCFAFEFFQIIKIEIQVFLGHFFKISSLTEKYESIGLLDLLCLTTLS